MKKKLLIVEDEPASLKVLHEKFKLEGFHVLIAKDGKKGLISAIRNKPDLILLDVLMPVMDGIQMLEELRKNPWGKGVKVVLLTNLADPRVIDASRKLNAKSCLIKSDWRIDDIVKEVNKKLKKN